MYTLTEKQKEIIHEALIIACDNGNYDVFSTKDFDLLYQAEQIISNL